VKKDKKGNRTMAKKNEKIKKPAHKTAHLKAKKKKSKSVLAKKTNSAKAEIKELSAKAKKLRQCNFIKVLIENNFNISRACKAADVPRRTFYDWRHDDQEFAEQIDEAFEARIDEWEACLHKNIKAGSDACVIFALKTLGKARGWVERETSNSKVIEILSRALKDEITTREAAYQITMLGLPLPEVLKIELSKIQPEPPPPDLPESIKDEELERLYREQMSKIKEQEENWVPERQAEVKELKDELKGVESFGPDAEQKSNREGR
jgi:hypothetical protein